MTADVHEHATELATVGTEPVDRSTVTAVIPVFNESGGSLKRTLAGVRGQSRPPERVIVVDDASDRPATLEQGGESVEALRLSINGGVSNARNAGARLAGSDYILFVNCDVVLTPDWLERAAGFLDGHPDVGLVSGVIRPVVGPRILREWRLQVLEPKVHRSNLSAPTRVTWVVGHALLVRRDVFDAIGGFDRRFRVSAEDWDFSQRVRAAGRSVVHLPHVVAESYEPASVETLARKRIRNAGWALTTSDEKHLCAATRQLRPVATAASIAWLGAIQMARNFLKARIRFVGVDAVVTLHAIVLVWKALRATAPADQARSSHTGRG